MIPALADASDGIRALSLSLSLLFPFTVWSCHCCTTPNVASALLTTLPSASGGHQLRHPLGNIEGISRQPVDGNNSLQDLPSSTRRGRQAVSVLHHSTVVTLGDNTLHCFPEVPAFHFLRPRLCCIGVFANRAACSGSLSVGLSVAVLTRSTSSLVTSIVRVSVLIADWNFIFSDNCRSACKLLQQSCQSSTA